MQRNHFLLSGADQPWEGLPHNSRTGIRKQDWVSRSIKWIPGPHRVGFSIAFHSSGIPYQLPAITNQSYCVFIILSLCFGLLASGGVDKCHSLFLEFGFRTTDPKTSPYATQKGVAPTETQSKSNAKNAIRSSMVLVYEESASSHQSPQRLL